MRTGRIALAALGMAACVQTSTEVCGDGTVCRENTRCHTIAEPALITCVTQDQLELCAVADDRSACTFNGDPGMCLGGACFPAQCGDSIVDASEACDDGGRIDGDGCSANCMSRELCGDQLIDLARAEQCDDGRVGISGDGCSSRCLKEYDLWSDRSAASPGVRVDQAFARAPGGGVMMFGGAPTFGNTTAEGALGDAWRWDGVNWSEVTSATPPPSARSAASAAYDPTRRELLLFGGRGSTGDPLDDLWRWDGVAWTDITPVGDRPSARWNASMACSTTRCILYGGRTTSGLVGDTWIWNGSWTRLLGAGPPARSRGSLVHIAGELFVLFGGVDPAPRADTWELTTVWQQKNSASNPPASALQSGALDAASGNVVLASMNATWNYKNGAWTNAGYGYPESAPMLAYDAERRVVAVSSARTPHEWDPSTGWGTTLPNRKPQAPRLGTTAAYSPQRGRTVLVETNGTWEWDMRSWRRMADTTPQSTVGTALVFDAACDHAVLFGGTVSSAPVNQTWTYNGTWTNPGLSPAPPARAFHAMTYDSGRGVVVVFGGAGASSQLLGDVWELRGPCTARVWTQVPTTTGPSPRKSARLAYDAVRNVSVLFGGNDGQEKDDTWEWNGTTWVDRTLATKPPARTEHAMVYDARRRAVVMFGGGIASSYLADSWKWDGSAWTRLLPIASPPGRRGMAMTTDAVGALVIFGGEGEAVGPVTDVWRLVAETNFEPLERCVVGGVDEDGDGLQTCEDPDCAPRCTPLCAIGEPCTGGPRCGDGTCSFIEDYVLCPADCTPP